MDREVVPKSTRLKILQNFLRGWNAYQEGRPGLALLFLRRAMMDLQNLIRKIEQQTEE